MTIRTRPNVLLILGAGWTSTFLIPLLKSEGISYAATSTTGHDDTIKFVFDPDSDDTEAYEALPDAEVVLVTFPMKGTGQSKRITELYGKTHASLKGSTQWIQLGSTGIFTAPHWNDCDSEHDTSNARAVAEDELLGLGGCVLNLAGLYGGTRDPRNWLTRVAKTKEEVRGKKALHLVHGDDVARGIVAVVKHKGKEGLTMGKRWLLTDLHVYCWWDLFMEWGREIGEKEENKEKELSYRKWVLECMDEEGVRALPRDAETLGRVLDSRAFWSAMGIWPGKGSVLRGE